MTLTQKEVREKYSDTKRRRCVVHVDGYQEKVMHLTKAEMTEYRHSGYRVKEQN